MKAADAVRIGNIRMAVAHLRHARELLARAGCRAAVGAVRRALKSADGAERNARRLAGLR